MQYINLKTLERNKVTTLVMRKFFLMYWGVLLFGVAALTSCVQDYLYEEFYDEYDDIQIPRNKKSKSEGSLGGNIAPNCNLIVDEKTSKQTDCVKSCMRYTFGLSETDINSILVGRAGDRGVYGESNVDSVVYACIAKYNEYQQNRWRPKEARCEIVSGGSVRSYDIALIVPGTRFVDVRGNNSTTPNGHVFIVDEVTNDADSWITGLIDEEAHLYYIKSKKSVIKKAYRITFN